MTTAISSFGTLLKMGDAASPEVFTTIANLGDIDGAELSSNMEDVTGHDSSGGYEEVIPEGVLNTGEIGFEINWVPGGSTHGASSGLVADWKNKTKRNYQLVHPNSSTWAFSGYVAKFQSKAPVRGVLRADVSIKLTGSPTLT
jgi:hypothetical protein